MNRCVVELFFVETSIDNGAAAFCEMVIFRFECRSVSLAKSFDRVTFLEARWSASCPFERSAVRATKHSVKVT